MTDPEPTTNGGGGSRRTPRRDNPGARGATEDAEARGTDVEVFDPVARLAGAIERVIIDLIYGDDSPPPSPPPREAPGANPPSVAAQPLPPSPRYRPEHKSGLNLVTKPKEIGAAAGQ